MKDINTDQNDCQAHLYSLIDEVLELHREVLEERIPAVRQAVDGARQQSSMQGACACGELQVLFELLVKDLQMHMDKEEAVYFPYIRRMLAAGKADTTLEGGLSMPLDMLRHEHADTHDLLESIKVFENKMKQEGAGCPYIKAVVDQLKTFASRFAYMRMMEDRFLFPYAVQAEQSAITGA